MIYLPRRAVFIHVPRTGGNSITSAIASVCAGQNYDIYIGTGSHSDNTEYWSMFARHTQARTLHKIIPEWDSIFKFAIFRPEEERLESIKRLVQKDIDEKVHETPFCANGWKSVLTAEDKQFYWDACKRQDLAFYTKGQNGEDLGVEIFNYHELDQVWPDICDRCQIPQCELPHFNSSK